MVDAEDLSLPRETGEEKATKECPTCGAELPVVVSEYGSRSTGVCPKCWSEDPDAESQLAAQQAAAEEESGGDHEE